ncbi:MAG: C40 family peptidase [Firmicutes bacterium]|nr:C40 family peptidase [Bacillota bacterium]
MSEMTGKIMRRMKRSRPGLRLVLLVALLAAAASFALPQPAMAATEAPQQVKVIKAVTSYDSITLKWNASENATDYIVYRAKSKYGFYHEIKTTSATTFTDRKLQTGKAQWYKIRAINEDKRSRKSPRISAAPTLSPPVLTAEATGEGIYLSMEKSEGADGYAIYRDGKSLSTQKKLTYLDSDVYSGKGHKYKAVAFRYVEGKVVASKFSREIRATRPSMSISISKHKSVPDLHEGEAYEFTGKIKSNTTIEKVTAGIVDQETNKWVSGAKFTAKSVDDMEFDLSDVNEKISVEQLEQGKYNYKIIVKLKTGSEKTILNQGFEITEPPGSTLLVETAQKLAWPQGTSKGTYSYPGGHRTDAYTEALSQAFGSRSGWSAQTAAGASCDVFVGTVVRNSGYDESFPRGLDMIVDYCSKHTDKWLDTGITRQEDMQPGDILFQLYKGGGGHIAVYLGDGLVANAHYHGKAYGVVQSMYNGGGIHKSWRTFKVYRPLQ